MKEHWRYGVFEYKIVNGSLWMLIFQHNTTHGYFENRKDAEFKLHYGKFSLLSKLSDSRYVKRYNESFEFLLEYPDNYTDLSNHWLQAVDPFLHGWSETTDKYAPGFVDLGLQIKSSFYGLMKQETEQKSLIDGAYSSIWDWAIGDYCREYFPLTPGPPFIRVSSVYLWIKVLQPYIIKMTCKVSPRSYFFISFIFVTIS